jgi:hypothetical protein
MQVVCSHALSIYNVVESVDLLIKASGRCTGLTQFASQASFLTTFRGCCSLHYYKYPWAGREDYDALHTMLHAQDHANYRDHIML